jgi:MFS family permease
MGAAMPFYFVLVGLYYVDPLDGLGISVAQATLASTLAQSLELLLFPLLAAALARFGVRWVLFMGLAAWPIRFSALMLGAPTWWVLGAQVLHGVNVVFWMAAAVIAVDLLARRNIRASAQGLYSMTFAGVGALCGQLLVGVVYGHHTSVDGRHDWSSVFVVPFAFTMVGAVAFLLLFREPGRQPDMARATESPPIRRTVG